MTLEDVRREVGKEKPYLGEDSIEREARALFICRLTTTCFDCKFLYLNKPTAEELVELTRMGELHSCSCFNGCVQFHMKKQS